MYRIDVPIRLSQAISRLESYVASIRADFLPDSYVRTDDDLLNALAEFIDESSDNSGIEVVELQSLSNHGGRIRAIVAKTPERIAALARHIANFCRLRRCSVVVRINDTEINTDAPNVEDCERLLRVVEQLFIRPNDDTIKSTDGSDNEK
jgi:hypothetical protein